MRGAVYEGSIVDVGFLDRVSTSLADWGGYMRDGTHKHPRRGTGSSSLTTNSSALIPPSRSASILANAASSSSWDWDTFAPRATRSAPCCEVAKEHSAAGANICKGKERTRLGGEYTRGGLEREQTTRLSMCHRPSTWVISATDRHIGTVVATVASSSQTTNDAPFLCGQ